MAFVVVTELPFNHRECIELFYECGLVNSGIEEDEIGVSDLIDGDDSDSDDSDGQLSSCLLYTGKIEEDEIGVPDLIDGIDSDNDDNDETISFIEKFRKRLVDEPQLLLTLSCSSNWPEIKERFGKDQTAFDRPDIITMVFLQRLEALLYNLENGKYQVFY